MEKIIDGKALAQSIQQKLTEEIHTKHLHPSLAVLLIGDDPASRLYVNLKKKACQNVGIDFHEYFLPDNIGIEKVLETINFLNKDEAVDAILVQLPLPKDLDTDIVIRAIDPKKDVDGFHPENIKKLLANTSGFVPGLPLGIIKLLEATGENLNNKSAVIVAKNDVFFQPLTKILSDKNIRAKLVDPKNPDLEKICAQADILIVAVGQAFFIGEKAIKKDAIVIDIGTNKIDEHHIVGDVDYSAVFDKVSHITPVPGGVGPMTVAMLLYNTLQLHKTKNT
ncbi:MAG: bifunctional 5,10-methylenetetrahydrofolate dehydrogenase/5,10-methenyltetrahydrofolate cyclohydrolase [Patescibacteria group bacterium]